jgi:hypothetical protein
LLWLNTDSFMPGGVVTRAAISDQPALETDKYGGEFHGYYESTCETHRDKGAYETRTDSNVPEVACLLAHYD